MKGLYKKVTRGAFSSLNCYSQDFNSVVSCMLTLDPKKRPSASEILRLQSVVKRVNLKEESDNLSSNLLNTIRFTSNIMNMKDQLPEAKYIGGIKSEMEHNALPKIGKMKRGATYKHLEEAKKSQEIPIGYYRHSSKKSKYHNKSQIQSILRENYGALKLPRVKYPYHVNKIKDASPIEIKEIYENNGILNQERIRGYKL